MNTSKILIVLNIIDLHIFKILIIISNFAFTWTNEEILLEMFAFFPSFFHFFLSVRLAVLQRVQFSLIGFSLHNM